MITIFFVHRRIQTSVIHMPVFTLDKNIDPCTSYGFIFIHKIQCYGKIMLSPVTNSLFFIAFTYCHISKNKNIKHNNKHKRHSNINNAATVPNVAFLKNN